MQLLIAKSSSLGDIVHALPAVRAYKAAYPEVHIDWLIERDLAPVLYGHPVVRRLVRFDSRGPRRKPRTFAPYRQLMRDMAYLRRVRYDVVIDLQRLIKSAVLMGMVRAKKRVGFTAAACREPLASIAYSQHVAVDYYNDPVRLQYLAPLQAISKVRLVPPIAPHLRPLSEAQRRAADKLGAVWDRPFGIALMGVGFETKAWPFEHWLDLLDRLPRDYPVVLTWASEAEREQCLSMASFIRQAVVPPAFSLPELVAVCDQAAWVVGGDTGPLHLAAALDTPTVSFYGPTHVRRDAPPGHIAIQSPVPCTGCFKRHCPKSEMDCLKAVTPDMVWEPLEKMLL